MKKLIFLFSLSLALLVSTATMAQVASVPVPTLMTNETGVTAGVLKSALAHVATDTVTNATAKHQYATIMGHHDLLKIQVRYTEISGTSAGTAKLYGSLDGVAYEQIGTDSLLITDVATAQTRTFEVTPSEYVYYRVTWQGSGTMSGKGNCVWMVRDDEDED